LPARGRPLPRGRRRDSAIGIPSAWPPKLQEENDAGLHRVEPHRVRLGFIEATAWRTIHFLTVRGDRASVNRHLVHLVLRFLQQKIVCPYLFFSVHR
jgi:hypothetical protein